jgi:2,4-dienoyl-CoA reductase-like NADH-dependent reductase (Old Yellow Enzyme family)
MSALLEPVLLGDSIELRNRVVMGSMTRNRCVDNGKPTEASVTHYAARAKDGVGLMVAEGSFISLHGAEWPHAPVMYTKEHAEAWRKVVDAVQAEGGKIFFQPWHPGNLNRHLAILQLLISSGRIQNKNMPLLKESGYPVLAPSPVPAAGGKFRELPGSPVNAPLVRKANYEILISSRGILKM